MPDDIRAGDTIVAGPGFPDLDEGYEAVVFVTRGPSPRLAIIGKNGIHPLAGYLDPNGFTYGLPRPDGSIPGITEVDGDDPGGSDDGFLLEDESGAFALEDDSGTILLEA